MTYIDLAIIYLACGSPLSMHYFFGLRGKPTPYFIARGILATLFWPVGIVSLLRDASRARAKGASISILTETDMLLDSIRVEMESVAFQNKNTASVFEFREVFTRYTGLVQAASAIELETDVGEIFRLSEHGNGQLATRCINRVSSLKLVRHADDARTEFISLIDSLSKECSLALADLAQEAGVLLDDQVAIERIYELSRRLNTSNSRNPRKIQIIERTQLAHN